MITFRLTNASFPHVRVCIAEDQLTLEYGRVIGDEFRIELTEHLHFSDHPELRGVHDGFCWNLTELYCLLDEEGHHITLNGRLRTRLQEARRGNRPRITNETTEEVYLYLLQFVEQWGWAPSLKEISEACFIAPATVGRHLSLLEAWGYLTRDPAKVRAIRLLADDTG